jgi:hypothetical protein
VGADTQKVLAEMLSYPEDKIESLRAAGVIGP